MAESRPPNGNGHLAAARSALDVFKFIMPMVLAIAGGYGAVRFTAGANEQRITNNEVKIMDLQKQIDRDREHFATNDTLKAYVDGLKAQLSDIQDNVRALRNSR